LKHINTDYRKEADDFQVVSLRCRGSGYSEQDMMPVVFIMIEDIVITYLLCFYLSEKISELP